MPETFESQVVAFDPTQGLALLDNAVDAEAGTIKGVSLATAGVEAIGHGEHDEETGELLREFWTDQTTLETMLEACLAIGEPMKAKMEHGTGLAEVVGTFDNFRIEGEHLRADFASIDTSAGVKHLFSLAQRISKQFGVSVTALLSKVTQGGVDLMRCTGIDSADFVERPAINAGLFSRKTHLANKGVSTKPIHNMTDEEFNSKLAEGLKPFQEQLSALQALMPKAPTEDELAADKVAADKATEEDTAAKAELSELKAKVETLGTQNTELSTKLETATAESKRLGITFGATLQAGELATKQATDFKAEMSKKEGEGKDYHVALSELRSENMELCVAEAKRRNLPSVNML